MLRLEPNQGVLLIIARESKELKLGPNQGGIRIIIAREWGVN